MRLYCLLRNLALGNGGVQRLVAEYVLAGIQCNLDLVGVEHGRGDDDNGIQLRIGAHFLKIGVGVRDVKFCGHVLYALCVNVADCGQLCAGNAGGNVFCVLISQTAQTDGTNFNNLFHVNFPPVY